MNTKTIRFEYSDLSSRSFASNLRNEVVEAINKKSHVVFDLRNVESISPSFCDELFAILNIEIGEELFSKRIFFKVKNRSIIESISEAISERKLELV